MDAATRSRLDARIEWVEDEIEAVLASRTPDAEIYAIERYHLGVLSATFEPLPRDLARRYGGKKLRGVICLLACEAAGGDPQTAVPAAAAIELIHNFSLIHDDLEDGDPERRHRPTVWSIWGVATALMTTTCMNTLGWSRVPPAGHAPSRLRQSAV